MKINLKNYEEYFVRYIDDELSHEEANEVTRFLHEHPELKQELEAFRSVILPVENEIRFDSKQSFKKGITTANCDEYFVRKIEGQLSIDEERELAQFLQFNPQFHRDLKAFEATKLVGDNSIVFPNKRSLKKRDGRVIPIGIRYLASAALAASLLVIFMIKGIQWNQSGTSTQTAQQSQTENQSEKNNSDNKNPFFLQNKIKMQ
jgi:anti-sigma factor RsiW